MNRNKLNETINNIMQNILCETDYNYHLTRDEIEGNGRPYVSDNRKTIVGRDTGHFGSGTYFASYMENGYNKMAQDDSRPNFIKIKDGIYRVDMDFYKNLYRVNSKEEGNLLYTTLRCLNAIYNNIIHNNYNNALLYQKIHNNISYLELEDISYKDLVGMIKRYISEDKIQSFSTYFMEQNGYNGVNVSGIPGFDNTTHGSVIYNLDNIEIRQANPKSNKKDISYFNDEKGGYSDNIGKSDYDDDNREFIRGEYVSNIGNMSLNMQSRYVKNALENNNFLDSNILNNLNDKVVRIYFKLLYNKKDFGTWYNTLNEVLKNHRDYIKYILEYNLLYYANIPSDNNYSVILELINNYWRYYDDDNKEEKEQFVNTIHNSINRKLTPKEEDMLQKFIEY